MPWRFNAASLEILSAAGFCTEQPESRQIQTGDLFSSLLKAKGLPGSVLRVNFGLRPRLLWLRHPSPDPLVFSPASWRALEFAEEERRSLGSPPGTDPDGIDPTHLLLGLLNLRSCDRWLNWECLDAREVREEVYELLGLDPAPLKNSIAWGL